MGYGPPGLLGRGRSWLGSPLAKNVPPPSVEPQAWVPPKPDLGRFLSKGIQKPQARTFERDYEISVGPQKLKLHVKIYQPAQRGEHSQTFVLVHGFQANGAAFAHLAPRLQQDGHKIYVIDLPGHGKSERPDWFPYSDPDAYVEALHSFLTNNRLSKIHLVGHSMGGGLMAHYALKYPENLSKLTLLSPWSEDIPISSFGKALPGLTRLFLGMLPTLNMKRGLRNTSWDRSWTRDNPVMDRLTAPIHRTDSKLSFPSLLQKTVEMDWSKLEKALSPKNIARLKKRVGTVKIFYGEQDPLIPLEDVQELNEKLGGQLILVENAGHVLPSEAPELAAYISGKKNSSGPIVHQRQTHPDLPTDSFSGPYFQGGFRGAFQSGVKPGNYQSVGQIFINLDHDRPGHLQLGLEFGAQGFKSFTRKDWSLSAYFQPKFYWLRSPWAELSTGVIPSAGVGRFQPGGAEAFFSLDAQSCKAEFILLNSGFLTSVYSALNTNLFLTELSSDRNLLERSSVQLGLSLSL